jgi:hypothetical protein
LPVTHRAFRHPGHGSSLWIHFAVLVVGLPRGSSTRGASAQQAIVAVFDGIVNHSIA